MLAKDEKDLTHLLDSVDVRHGKTMRLTTVCLGHFNKIYMLSLFFLSCS